MRSPTGLIPMLLTAATVLGAAPSLTAQEGETAYRQAVGPCPYQAIDVARYGLSAFREPPVVQGKGGRLVTTLKVQYTDAKTTSIGGCPLTLRTYNGQLVGPTLRLRPGDTLNIELDNVLPKETPTEVAAQLEQEASQAHIATTPHSFNTTNLHTHGLHVSPVGNSDNVLLAIPPQTQLPYEIKVPPDHPAGTYWYHAHAHGSTAIQVGSGMAGALIIEDPGNVPPALRAAREQVFVFQTILYDTHGRVDDITAFFPDSSATKKLCQQGKPGCTWANSQRRTTINGQVVPRIKMRPGEVRRWRLVDAAFRATFNVQLEGHALHEIALDGIYLGRIDTWGPSQSVELQPGYRSDVLVKASATPGTYKLIDAASAAARSVRGVAEDADILAEVVVEGHPMDMRLPTSAEMKALEPFPGVDLQKEADGVQTVVFKLGSDRSPTDQRAYFQVNYRAFDPARVRQVRLGATDQWTLTTVGDDPCSLRGGIPPLPHVFHIHVNPFQWTRRGPDGRDQTVWKDTLFIPVASHYAQKCDQDRVPASQTLNVFTRYTDYIGKFVMHCHILDHEDLGMMEVVEVVGEQSAAALPSHGGH